MKAIVIDGEKVMTHQEAAELRQLRRLFVGQEALSRIVEWNNRMEALEALRRPGIQRGLRRLEDETALQEWDSRRPGLLKRFSKSVAEFFKSNPYHG